MKVGILIFILILISGCQTPQLSKQISYDDKIIFGNAFNTPCEKEETKSTALIRTYKFKSREEITTNFPIILSELGASEKIINEYASEKNIVEKFPMLSENYDEYHKLKEEQKGCIPCGFAGGCEFGITHCEEGCCELDDFGLNCEECSSGSGQRCIGSVCTNIDYDPLRPEEGRITFTIEFNTWDELLPW
jgi:hypothetical protein